MKYLTDNIPANYAVVQRCMGDITAKYPFVCRVPLGKSAVGRQIDALVLCCPGKRPTGRTLFAAALHGQEWLSTLVLLRFCEEICFCMQNGFSMVGVNVRKALEGRTVIMIPQMNPDGVEIALHGSQSAGTYAPFVAAHGGDTYGLWEANAQGVDLLRNFSVNFDAVSPCSPLIPSAHGFRGEAPESAPETAALCALCRRLRLRHATVLRTGGEEICWDFGKHTPVSSHMMAEIMASAAGYVTAIPQNHSHGFERWFVEEFEKPAFTIKLGRGQNPLPTQEVSSIGKRVRETLLLNAMM